MLFYATALNILVFIDAVERLQVDTLFVPWQRGCMGLRFKDKCYMFGTVEDDWYDSRLYCEELGYKLVQINSVEEADVLATESSRTGYNYFWTAANDDRTEGVWLFPDRTPAFVQPLWNFMEPGGDWREDCVEIVTIGMHKGRMNDIECETERRAVCERETAKRCPRIGYHDRCYIFSQHRVPYIEAIRQCKVIGMRLARVMDADMRMFISTHQRGNSWVDLSFGTPSLSATMFVGAVHPSLIGPLCTLLKTETFDGVTSRARCTSPRLFVCESEPHSTQGEDPVDIAIDEAIPVALQVGVIGGSRRRRKSVVTKNRRVPAFAMPTYTVGADNETILQYACNCVGATGSCNSSSTWSFV